LGKVFVKENETDSAEKYFNYYLIAYHRATGTSTVKADIAYEKA
jgi:hypothetical protein